MGVIASLHVEERPVADYSLVREAAHASTPARRNRLKSSAWGVIGVTTGFIALTCWWLSRDRSIPIYDAGAHLRVALAFHDWLRAGHLSRPFTFTSQYPPLAPLVGAWAAFIGGINVASPIIGENLIFVPLLTLGCYQTGRLLFGVRAGLLAAVFALGSPLLIARVSRLHAGRAGDCARGSHDVADPRQ